MEEVYSSTTNMGDERGLGKSVMSPRVFNACVSLPRVSDFKDVERTMKVDSSSKNNLEINCARFYDDLVSKAWPSIFHDFEFPVGGGRDKGCLLFPVGFEPPIPPPPLLSSPPKNVDFSQRDLSFEGDPNNPFKRTYRPPPCPLENVRSQKRICSSSYRTYVSSIAKHALTYFNSKQNVDFHFNELCDFGINHGPKSTIHLNFIAESTKYEEPKLFYAEAKIWYVDGKTENEVKIQGCSMLMQTGRGNHLGFRCLICGDKVIHPGPRDGYAIIMGDSFEKSSFWRCRLG